MSIWKLTIKSFTGLSYDVEVPSTETVQYVKKLIEAKDPSAPLNLQRLIVEVGTVKQKLDDDKKLSAYPNINDGSTLNLVILTSCIITVQGVDGRMHTIAIPSSDPEKYSVKALCVLVGKALGHGMGGYQLLYQGQQVVERKNSKEMTLGDYSIKANATLVVTKLGMVLEVTNPQVDVCFLVDCTGSMASHIEAVKNNIQDLRDRLVREYTGSDLIFAFVGYTDYDQAASTRTSVLQYTSNPSTFRNFVSAVTARGGGDIPEDIMGGFKIAFQNLNWRSDSCKILIHIADAPCHGSKYHNCGDSYRNGDPAGISHESMMAEIVRLDIQYWFGYINKQITDKMIGIFNDSLCAQSLQRLIIRQFDAMKCSELGAGVQRSVIASVYGKAALKATAAVDFTLDPNVPDWNDPSIVEQDAKITPPPKLHDSSTDREKPTVDFTFKIAPNPFAEGSNFYVYYASDLVNFRKIVLKRFKQAEKFTKLECYLKELEARAISAIYAHEFNSDRLRPQNTCSIDFTQLDVVRSDGRACYLLERYLTGKIENFDDCDSEAEKTFSHCNILQAFSHYTWVKSSNTLLISSLQGYKLNRRERIILVGPAVLSNGGGGKYGIMDSGIEGIQKFFNSHTCSAICEQMKLAGQTI